MKLNIQIGKQGEDIATDYLRKKGYTIIDRNFKARYEEVDIVAVHKKILIFIEVKTRTSTAYGLPIEAITYFKLQSLIKAAQFYSLCHPKLPQDLRIDAVSVQLDSNEQLVSIEHRENISGF